MPRGEETQEGDQETSREVKAQDEVKEQETQRDAEVVAEPEAVVERERPVEESEAIEAEVVEAIEAVEIATEDRGPETGEEISTLPVPIPGQPDRPGDEISATPIPLPGEENVDPDGVISATPIPLPGEENVDPDGLISATPIPLPDPPRDEISATPRTGDGGAVGELDETSWKIDPAHDDLDARVEGEILDETSFKFFTTQEDRDAPAEGEIMDDTSFKFFTPQPEQETDEILAEIDFKPVPAEGSAEEIAHEDHWSGRDGSEVGNDPIPMPSPAAEEDGGLETVTGVIEVGEGEGPAGPITEEAQEGEEDEGSSILIGEEEELQEIDLTTEASKEVEEYWEPPEMYIYQNQDGSIAFVDANGKPIDCPPNYSKEPETGEIKAWYPGKKNVNAFDIPPFPGHDPKDIFAYTAPDGSVTLVDSKGNPVPSPPEYMRDGDVGIVTKNAAGEVVSIKAYTPPLDNIFLYQAQDGSYSIVDKNGNPVESPPHLVLDGDNEPHIKGNYEEVIKIESYQSPLTNIFAYTAQDGSFSIVDKNGNLVKCPPHVDIEYTGIGAKFHTPDGTPSGIEIPPYKPPLTGIYAYTAQDGSVYVVDKDGKQVNCPPHVNVEQGPLGTEFHTPDGSASGVDIPPYQPPIKDIFIHVNQDGSIDIVDKSGKMVESPPIIQVDYDPLGKAIYRAHFAGTPIEKSVVLTNYKPPSSHWDKK